MAPRLHSRPAAVIFDMDGLLLDTEPLAVRAWNDAAAALGVDFDDALALAKAGLKPEFAEVTMKPTTEVEMTGEDAAKMQKLLDAIEALDDVQNVHTNAVLDG